MAGEVKEPRSLPGSVSDEDTRHQEGGLSAENFGKSRKRAGLVGFRFHDFRHTAVTTMRRAGVDMLTSMQITRHKTMVCFTPYNSFREADLRAAVAKSDTYRTLAHTKAAEEAAANSSKATAST
jgi:integrase